SGASGVFANGAAAANTTSETASTPSARRRPRASAGAAESSALRSSLSSTQSCSSPACAMASLGRELLAKERARLLRRAGPGEEVALAFVAAVRAQELQLLRGLHALGEHAQAERVAERDDRLRDRRVAAAFRHRVDEGAVDLYAVHRQAGEVAQAGVAGAEVVHRYLHAELLQALEDGDGAG